MPEQRNNSSHLMLIIGAIIVLALAVGGYFTWKSLAAEPPVVEPVVEVPVVEPTTAYASTALGFSLKYPNGFIVNETYSNTSVNPQKPIAGIKFMVPLTMATGTNLSSDSGISIEQLPRAKSCTGDIYLSANVRALPYLDGATRYSLATSSEAGAGNLYEEMVYAIASSSPCTAVRYFIHSTQLENYPAGTVRAFDRALLLQEFDKIRQSVVLTPATI